MSRPLPKLLALVLPTLIIGGTLYLLGSEPTKDQERQLRNAGMLLNGEVLERPAVEVIDELMDADPRLVVLGNSFANTNVLLKPLAQSLGLGDRAARLSIPNTIGAHWYAMLKYRVFTEAYEAPDVVLIASDLQSALLTTPLSEGSMGNLVALSEPGDPELEARVGRNTSWWWTTVLEGRRRWRFTAVNRVKETSARIVHPSAKPARLRRLTNDAMDQVFHPARTRPDLARRALPFAGIGVNLGDLPDPEAGFLRPIAQLCYEHGARLVLVRNRESPLIPHGQGDIVPHGTEGKVRALIEPYGGVLLDSRRLPMIAEQFDNIDHMTREGSKRFTTLLAQALRDVGVPDERLSRPPPPRFEGEPSQPYPQVRQSWRDRPGTWSFDAWDAPELHIRARIEGGALELNGAQLPFEPGANGVRRYDVRVPHDGEPFTLASTGLVTALAVGDGAPRLLVGHRSDLDAKRLHLLGTPEVFDGDLYLEGMQPTFEKPPPPMVRPRRRFSGAAGGTGAYDVPRLSDLSDLGTRRHTPWGARCSPVRVREDGELLPRPNVGCEEVEQLRSGRMCHGERQIRFSATDTTHPRWNGRTYTLALDPDRSCDGGFWLYPADRASLQVDATRLLELREGTTALQLDVAFPTPRPASIEVQVWVDGQLHAKAGVQRETGRNHRLAFERVLPTRTIELRFVNAEKGFVLVNQATLLR